MRSSVKDNSMDAICEPGDKVEVYLSSDTRTLYVHVNGTTVFRLGCIDAIVTDVPIDAAKKITNYTQDS